MDINLSSIYIRSIKAARLLCAGTLVRRYMVRLYFGTSVHWYVSTLVHLSVGNWFVVTMVHWYISTLVRWYVGTLIHWYVGTLVRKYFGTYEHAAVFGNKESHAYTKPTLSNTFKR